MTNFVNCRLTCQLLSSKRQICNVSGLGSCCSIQLGRTQLDHLVAFSQFRFSRLSVDSNPELVTLFHRRAFSQIIRLTTRTKIHCSLHGPRTCISDGLIKFTGVLRNYHSHISRLVCTSSDSICKTGGGIPFTMDSHISCPVSFCTTAGGSGRLVTCTCDRLCSLPIAKLHFFAICNP